jgi:phage terminase small subunit
MDKRSKTLEIDAEYVLKTIRDTIERCSQAAQVKQADGSVSGEYRFDATNVLKGSELLGKHLKMFTDKLDVGGQGDNPLQIQIVRFSDAALDDRD